MGGLLIKSLHDVIWSYLDLQAVQNFCPLVELIWSPISFSDHVQVPGARTIPYPPLRYLMVCFALFWGFYTTQPGGSHVLNGLTGQGWPGHCHAQTQTRPVWNWLMPMNWNTEPPQHKSIPVPWFGSWDNAYASTASLPSGPTTRASSRVVRVLDRASRAARRRRCVRLFKTGWTQLDPFVSERRRNTTKISKGLAFRCSAWNLHPYRLRRARVKPALLPHATMHPQRSAKESCPSWSPCELVRLRKRVLSMAPKLSKRCGGCDDWTVKNRKVLERRESYGTPWSYCRMQEFSALKNPWPLHDSHSRGLDPQNPSYLRAQILRVVYYKIYTYAISCNGSESHQNPEFGPWMSFRCNRSSR